MPFHRLNLIKTSKTKVVVSIWILLLPATSKKTSKIKIRFFSPNKNLRFLNKGIILHIFIQMDSHSCCSHQTNTWCTIRDACSRKPFSQEENSLPFEQLSAFFLLLWVPMRPWVMWSLPPGGNQAWCWKIRFCLPTFFSIPLTLLCWLCSSFPNES